MEKSYQDSIILNLKLYIPQIYSNVKTLSKTLSFRKPPWGMYIQFSHCAIKFPSKKISENLCQLRFSDIFQNPFCLYFPKAFFKILSKYCEMLRFPTFTVFCSYCIMNRSLINFISGVSFSFMIKQNRHYPLLDPQNPASGYNIFFICFYNNNDKNIFQKG